MFRKVLHANDGSDHAFDALAQALRIAKENGCELHMVCVQEVDYLPEFMEEVREETGNAARRFHAALQRARAMAEEQHVPLKTHVVAGHAVRDILKLAEDLGVDLLVIGGTGHSAFYERMLGTTAARVVHMAKCPVLVVK
ncbi:MAG TPA: universal stress protein [Xanthobacteraceae bacterium]|nr:universal stress protein [Xanthobacteraceae bacterium]